MTGLPSWRLLEKRNARHSHVSVFVGPDADHRALAGRIVLDHDQADDLFVMLTTGRERVTVTRAGRDDDEASTPGLLEPPWDDPPWAWDGESDPAEMSDQELALALRAAGDDTEATLENEVCARLALPSDQTEQGLTPEAAAAIDAWIHEHAPAEEERGQR